jgi:hypothetical protein
LIERNAGSETDHSDKSRQHDNLSGSSVEQMKLDRLANEAAEQGERTKRRNDRDHDIFTK